VDVRWGQIRRIWWVYKYWKSWLDSSFWVGSGWWAGALSCKNKTHLVKFRRFFFQNVLQLHRQRWVILGVDILALWKINSEKVTTLITKNRGEKFSSGLLTRNYLRGEQQWRHSLSLSFVFGDNDVTRFRPWSPNAQEIIWMATKISIICSGD